MPIATLEGKEIMLSPEFGEVRMVLTVDGVSSTVKVWEYYGREEKVKAHRLSKAMIHGFVVGRDLNR